MRRVKECSKKLVLILMTVFFSVNILSENILISYAASDPLDTVIQYVKYIGHDWDKLAELYTSNVKDSYASFLANENNKENNIGILNVINAELVEIVQVAFDDVSYLLSDDYEGKTVKTYAVGIDYSVKENSIFYSNGIAYNVFSIVLEDDSWKVDEFVQIENPEELIEKGYEFSPAYDSTLVMMEAREEGVLVSGDGEIFDTIGDIIEVKDINASVSNSIATRAMAKNTETVPTESTQVCVASYSADKKVYYYIDKNGNHSTKYCTIPFYDYCLGVTAGEARQSNLDGTARRSIIIAIKTFTWHYCIYPRIPAIGANVNLNHLQQDFEPDLVGSNPKITIDFNLVKNVWMESSDGYIFTAYYKKGTEDGSGKSGGELYQLGCKYLAGNGYTYMNILRYYYDNSTIDGKSIGKVRFFNSQKKCYK